MLKSMQWAETRSEGCMYPVLPPKEYNVADLLSAIHSVSNPAIPFNLAVFNNDFGKGFKWKSL